jgi:putative phosphoserine phosphatase/1-acylglycerol-3-phosphate O-acyltransferase
VGLWGTEVVWPRSSRLPDPRQVRHPAPVSVRVGRPVVLSLTDARADTARIMEAITSLLPPAARQGHEPTADELDRTRPPR